MPHRAGLTKLSLTNNRIQHLSPSLAGATRLQELLLASNPGFRLTAESVEMLAALPVLQTISLDGELYSGASIVARLARLAPALSIE